LLVKINRAHSFIRWAIMQQKVMSKSKYLVTQNDYAQLTVAGGLLARYDSSWYEILYNYHTHLSWKKVRAVSSSFKFLEVFLGVSWVDGFITRPPVGRADLAMLVRVLEGVN